jgi:hypothetical protein
MLVAMAVLVVAAVLANDDGGPATIVVARAEGK